MVTKDKGLKDGDSLTGKHKKKQGVIREGRKQECVCVRAEVERTDKV